MKKILTLLSLTLSMTAFANNLVESNTMTINATVIKPLTVKHSGNINFGNLIQGSGHSSKVNSSFYIQGSPNEKIELKINDQTVDSFSNSNLTKVGGTDTLPLYTNNRKINNSSNLTHPTLDTNGNLVFSFDSEVNVGNQPLGQYQGNLTVSVKYN